MKKDKNSKNFGNQGESSHTFTLKTKYFIIQSPAEKILNHFYERITYI